MVPSDGLNRPSNRNGETWTQSHAVDGVLSSHERDSVLAPRRVREHGPHHIRRASAFSGIIGFMTALFSIDLQAVRIVRAETKTQILGALADCFGEVYGLDRATVLERIEERETLGSTGFGRGVAIPHARLESLARPVAAFFRLERPVDFSSSDGMPVDCVFGLLSPEQAGATHLQALAAISRLMRDERMHERLIAAPDADAIYALLVNVIDRDAA